MTRIASLSREIAEAMQISFNGETFESIAPKIEAGEMALVGTDIGAYAIVSQAGDCVCIEAIEGPGGLSLFRDIIAAASAHGYKCEAWAMSQSRVRLAKRAGMVPTGESRVSGSGRVQYRVST